MEAPPHVFCFVHSLLKIFLPYFLDFTSISLCHRRNQERGFLLSLMVGSQIHLTQNPMLLALSSD
jgi:hypothetical protein